MQRPPAILSIAVVEPEVLAEDGAIRPEIARVNLETAITRALGGFESVAVTPVRRGEDDVAAIALQNAVDEVKMEQGLVDYIIALAQATRENEDLQVGVSPRGALALAQTARATALLQSRDYCVPEDIVSNVLPVCAHRVISKTYMNVGDTATTRRIMQQVLETVPSPA